MEPRPAKLTQASEAATDPAAALGRRGLFAASGSKRVRRLQEHGPPPSPSGGGESDLCSIQRPHHRIRFSELEQ